MSASLKEEPECVAALREAVYPTRTGTARFNPGAILEAYDALRARLAAAEKQYHALYAEHSKAGVVAADFQRERDEARRSHEALVAAAIVYIDGDESDPWGYDAEAPYDALSAAVREIVDRRAINAAQASGGEP